LTDNYCDRLETWVRHLKKLDPVRFKNLANLTDMLFLEEMERIRNNKEYVKFLSSKGIDVKL